MEWFNYYGLLYMLVIMIPNMIFAAKHPDGFDNKYTNKTMEVCEQIGRVGSFGFMIVNIPTLCMGFWFKEGLAVYLIGNSILCLGYCIIWILCGNKESVFRSLALSILPSLIFIISGIVQRNFPLVIASIVFAICHVTISYKNAVL